MGTRLVYLSSQVAVNNVCLFVFLFLLQTSVVEGNVPERMYKLVLAGDAAVGKSSFILRLCRNRFHSALNSTLGM